MFCAFPLLFASGFSGFYLPLMVALWLLILRGLSLELRNHLPNDLWRSLWDTVFAGASALLAIAFGAALGNVVRGVPLEATGYFFLPFFYQLSARSQPRHPGLVHHPDRDCGGACDCHARGAVDRLQDRRGGAEQSQEHGGRFVVGRGGAGCPDHAAQLPRATSHRGKLRGASMGICLPGLSPSRDCWPSESFISPRPS